jgi:hypothetical protein
MLNRFAVTALAALALAACGQQQGSGPPLPRLQEGAQAPTVLTPGEGGTEQSTVSEEVRQQLIAQMTDYLNQANQQFAPGMTPPEGMTDQIVPMQPGADHRWVVSLTGGSPYMFIGACDGDCSNVDIELIDMSTGGVVASDLLPDDFPVVQFTPPANASYMVRLMMRACSVAPCYAGARVLTGGGAPAK